MDPRPGNTMKDIKNRPEPASTLFWLHSILSPYMDRLTRETLEESFRKQPDGKLAYRIMKTWEYLCAHPEKMQECEKTMEQKTIRKICTDACTVMEAHGYHVDSYPHGYGATSQRR